MYNKSNKFELPSINGSDRVERAERERMKRLSSKYVVLDTLKRYNEGHKTVILASGADGNGNFDNHSSRLFQNAAQELAKSLGSLGVTDPSIINDARKEDLQDAITASSVANILLIGHGSLHSWVSTDGSVDWYRAGNMVDDHLKNGLFANVACGAVHSWNFVPLGNYVVGSQGTLIGKSKEFAYADELTDLTNFEVLKRK